MTITTKLTQLNVVIDVAIAKLTATNSKLDALLAELDGTLPPPVVPPAGYPLEWDARLTEIGVHVDATEGPRYVLIAAWLTKNGQWSGVDEPPAFAKKYQLDTLGGDHNVFGMCLDVNGTVIMSKNFVMQNGGTASRQPEADGWSNLPMSGQAWKPSEGPGPYSWYPLNGEKLIGLGMPNNQHWSFFGVWKAIS
jgi:hypothetical protein